MRLLIVNFAMDSRSPVLAWQEQVVRHLAARCSQVDVITESLGQFDAPANVRVFVVPRCLQQVPMRWMGGRWIAGAVFVLQILRRSKPDLCFIHMAMPWVYRLAWLLKPAGVPIVFWYAHGSTSFRLRAALSVADRAVTSTPEGLRLRSRKVFVIGQAIDLSTFALRQRGGQGAERRDLIYVGRITERKRIGLMLETVAHAFRLGLPSSTRLKVVGPSTGRSGERYMNDLRRVAIRLGIGDHVEFCGPFVQSRIAEAYVGCALHLNFSATGSLDKTILESLAMGCPVVSSNPASREVLQALPGCAFVDSEDPLVLARAVITALGAMNTVVPEQLRDAVRGQHSLEGYVDRVWGHLRELAPVVRDGRRPGSRGGSLQSHGRS